MASEDTKQFLELQKQFVDASGKLKQVAIQGRAREQQRTRAVLTLSELEPLPDSTNTFKGLGRAYVQDSKPAVMEELHRLVTDCDEELTKLKSSKEYLEKQVKEVESSITELLRTNESLAQQILAR